MSTLLNGHPVVERAYGEYLRFNNDARMRSLDEAHQRYLHDYATDLEAAESKGKIEGLAEGELKGKLAEKMETALIMKRKGFTVPDGCIKILVELCYNELNPQTKKSHEHHYPPQRNRSVSPRKVPIPSR